MSENTTSREFDPLVGANERVGTRFRMDDDVELPLPGRSEWVARDVDL